MVIFAITYFARPSASDSSSAAKSTTTLKPVVAYSPGTYEVGAEIPAGEYRLIADTSTGYLVVSTSRNSARNSIISNANFQTNDIITIKPGQFIKITGATAYPIAQAPTVDTGKSGTFKIGKDLPAGTYQLTATAGMGYVQIASNSTNTSSAVVSNDSFTSDTKVTVSDGQYLKLTQAHISK